MLRDYRRENANYEISEEERVIFEGIYVCSSLATSEVIIKMVEEYVSPVTNPIVDKSQKSESISQARLMQIHT